MVPWRGYTGIKGPYLVSTPVAFADSVASYRAASYRATCCQEATCERSQIMSLAAQNLLSEARFTDSCGSYSPARVSRDFYEELVAGLVDQLAQSSVNCIRIQRDRLRKSLNDWAYYVGTASLL